MASICHVKNVCKVFFDPIETSQKESLMSVKFER